MATIKTKLMVGIFVLLGFFIATGSIIWLGMSDYFEKGRYYVAYFDESVQGLDKDSPVKYQGVPIGRVEDIKVTPDATLIEVLMKIEEGLKPEEHRGNIVAQLKSVGITGIMFVEIERKKPNEPDLAPKINFTPQYPVVATKPSEIKKLIQGIDYIINQIKVLDVTSMSNKLTSTLDAISRGVEDLELKELSSGIRSSFARMHNTMDSIEATSSSLRTLSNNANHTVAGLDGIIIDNKEDISEAISELRRSMKDANRLLDHGTGLIKNADNSLYSFQHQLIVSLKNLENTTDELNGLIERVSVYPSQVFFGEPPPPRTIEVDMGGLR